MDNGADCYRRFLDGDSSAFEELVALYRSDLTFFISGFVRDENAAEDIAIDVFMQLVIHRHRYNFKCSLKTYLYTIARSRSLDFLKHRRRLRETELNDSENTPFQVRSPEDDYLQSERSRTLYNAIGTLPEEMRTAVHLVYFDDLSYEECATVMKKSRKQIDNLLYRAKKKLRELLGEEQQI